MRTATFAILVIAAMFVALGCDSPPALQEPPPIDGDFSGFYVIQIPAGRDSQPVSITFGSDTYFMTLDTASLYFGTHSFCNVSGLYTLTEGVRFVERTSTPLGGEHNGASFDDCSSDEGPSGTFSLIRKNGGMNLQLRQQANDTLGKELYLNRIMDSITITR